MRIEGKSTHRALQIKFVAVYAPTSTLWLATAPNSNSTGVLVDIVVIVLFGVSPST